MSNKFTRQLSSSSLNRQLSSSSLNTCPLTPSSSNELETRSATFTPPLTPGQTAGEKQCFRRLKNWSCASGISYEDSLIHRFACYYNYDLEDAKVALEQNQDNHLLRLQMRGSLMRQFDKGALFPLSGLKTKADGSEVVYFRPSRFDPDTCLTSLLIKNVCYVLNDLSSTEEQCRNGVAFVANMKSFSTKHYHEEFWLELLDVLQGKVVPTTISLFLILDPPTWFGRIWRNLKTQMSPEFAKKVRLTETEDLADYFHKGYQNYMPGDIAGCWCKASEMVEDYVDKRIFLEKQASDKKKKILYREMILEDKWLEELEISLETIKTLEV